MTEPSKREKLKQLQAEMQAEQNEAAVETLEILNSAEMQKCLDKLKTAQEKTIPGQYLDQSIGHVLQVVGAVKTTVTQQIPAVESDDGLDADGNPQA